MTDWWQPYRERELERIRARLDELAMDFARQNITGRQLAAESTSLRERSGLVATDPDWVADRPRRRMPALWAVVSYWRPWGVFILDIEIPHCFACLIDRWCDEDKPVPERWKGARWLERAHLADRCFGGLDGPQNFALLCHECHKGMPSFRGGDEAIRWVQSQSAIGAIDLLPLPLPLRTPGTRQESLF